MGKAVTPLPTIPAFIVICIHLCEALEINVLFPFVAFMVESFGYEGIKLTFMFFNTLIFAIGSNLGYYVGGLAASFCAAQFCSAMVWGRLSDQYGRKPILISGVVGAGLSMIVFGMATTYWQAVLGRVLSGLLSGNLGVCKSYLSEFTDETNRALGFSMISLAWFVGTIVGPLMGGLLVNPAERYPSVVSSHGIFGRYPYLLPCFLCCALNVFVSIVCLFFMEETRKVSAQSGALSLWTKKFPPRNRYVPLNDSSSLSAIAEDAEQFEIEMGTLPSPYDTAVEEEVLDRATIEGTTAVAVSELALLTVSDEATTTVSEPVVRERSASRSGLKDLPPPPQAESADPYATQQCCLCSLFYSKPSSKDAAVPVFQQSLVVMACASYGLLAMSFIMLDQTLPIFFKQSVHTGGMSFDSSEIGIVISISGFAALIFSIFVVPKLTTIFPLQYLYSVSVLASAPLMLLYPLLGLLDEYLHVHHAMDRGGAWLWICLVLVSIAKNCLSTVAFNMVMIQISHSVLSDDLGVANGLGQSLASLARAIGPALCGALWSVSVGIHFLSLNFLIVMALLIGCRFINHYLKPLNRQRLPSAAGGPSAVHMEMI